MLLQPNKKLVVFWFASTNWILYKTFAKLCKLQNVTGLKWWDVLQYSFFSSCLPTSLGSSFPRGVAQICKPSVRHASRGIHGETMVPQTIASEGKGACWDGKQPKHSWKHRSTCLKYMALGSSWDGSPDLPMDRAWLQVWAKPRSIDSADLGQEGKSETHVHSGWPRLGSEGIHISPQTQTQSLPLHVSGPFPLSSETLQVERAKPICEPYYFQKKNITQISIPCYTYIQARRQLKTMVRRQIVGSSS